LGCSAQREYEYQERETDRRYRHEAPSATGRILQFQCHNPLITFVLLDHVPMLASWRPRGETVTWISCKRGGWPIPSPRREYIPNADGCPIHFALFAKWVGVVSERATILPISSLI